VPALFGPHGTVWSSTVLRIPLPGRQPPLALAYVDLDNGPRVLGHLAESAQRRLHAGHRVRVAGTTHEGDPLFEPEKEGQRS
jgi:uncharacterized OB-fold protein